MKKTVQLIGLIILMSSCNSKPAISDAELEKKAEAAMQADLQKEQEKEVELNWKYEFTTDEMTDETTSFATCRSKNFTNLEFPYEGGTWLDLIVRKQGKKIDIYFVATKGQITTDYQNPSVKMRFDDEKPFFNGVTESSSNESNVRFLNGGAHLLEQIKTHKKLKIELVFYNQGTFVFDFDISDIPIK